MTASDQFAPINSIAPMPKLLTISGAPKTKRQLLGSERSAST
jgi:hypothetical protein